MTHEQLKLSEIEKAEISTQLSEITLHAQDLQKQLNSANEDLKYHREKI
jgi:hypothetical protein